MITPGPLRFLDALPPPSADSPQGTRRSLARPLPAPLGREALARAVSRGWLSDTLHLAAWALVLDRLLGQAHVTLSESSPGPDGAPLFTFSTHRSPGPEPAAAWVDELDRGRRAARANAVADGSGGMPEAVWVAQPAHAAKLDAPWVVGLDLEGEARLVAYHDAGVVPPALAESLLDCVAHALAGLIAEPDGPAREVDVLGPEQRARLLASWNRPLRDIDPGFGVVSAFRAVAGRKGERVAIEAGAIRMTYAELDRRSDAAARRLGEAGGVVAMALERTPEAIVALLGVLKAGAAYMPLDLRHPPSRIAFMLRDAGVSRVVVDERGRGSLPPGIEALDAAALAALPGEEMTGASQPDGGRLAYVMYTSGSTGEPKGIEILQRSIVRLVHAVDYVRLGPDEALLHAAPLGFDASTFEIWGALLNGARCVLHPEPVPTGPGLARAIRAHGVTTAWLTAALFNAIVDDDPRHLGGLRQLLIGGEALSVAHVRRALAALPEVEILNGYGPTECTTFSAVHRIGRSLDARATSIPIGRPITDTTLHVVNARRELMPAGFVGELAIGGRGLARGYLRRPALDAERFVPDPFGPEGARLYLTGDLARFLPDGTLDFLGRRDTQVKIRGFRIELGEIEAALAAHPGVRSVAVVAREDTPGDPRLVAYVVPAGAEVPPAELRAHLNARLPDFMVPAAFVRLEALPVTANGKLDRRALPRPERGRPALAPPYAAPRGPAEELVCRVFAETLGLDRAGRDDNFFELGGSSLRVLQAHARLRRETGREIPATVFFSNPTPAAIAAALGPGTGAGIPAERFARPADRAGRAAEPVAIVAMAGRFPGAASVEAFWANLRAGRETLTRFDDADLDPSIPRALRDDPLYVKARGVVEGVELFDAEFFGISPREAEVMDPQQRLFMELAWECLERGGYAPDECPGPVGIFGGMYNATYFQRHVSAHPERVAALGEFQAMLANEKDYVTTRTANRLNLTGPAVSVHTACSTSLVAVAQAVASLRAGQCDMALAGGASITCPPASGYLFQEGAMLAPDGHTRAFDAGAQGTVFSDGVAMVLLKRLSDALADGDTIHAVIRGVAVNNDGGAKASFTAPSVDGQAAVIAAALDDAGVDARTIEYVEAHGTATPLGDPVEVEALTRAFRRHTPDTGFCRLGSVKSNVGHVVIAAGATGLIKTALALAHEELPASLHFSSPNPKLRLESSPFVVNAALEPWPRRPVPRRAGVSSFGVGGTNAHVVVEEAPATAPTQAAQGPQLLQVSARTPSALAAATARLAAHLEAHPHENLADVAHTLRAGRKAFAERACVVAATAAEAAAALREASSPSAARARVGAHRPEVAFLFPGQAAQYAGMGSRLHATQPAFRDAFDECARILEPVLGFDLRERVFSGDGRALTETAITQPALFSFEYALARFWLDLGVRPRALAGHSVGEFAAAALAGVFRLEDAARLVARRGALMQALPKGSMLAVRAGAPAVLARMPAGLSLAAENSPGLTVVAGPDEAIESFRAALEADGVVARILQTSHAFHSAMMDPAIAPFEAEIRRVELSAPAIPIHSTVTGRLLGDAEARDPGYWARHLREPVRFSPALLSLAQSVPGVLLEVGPRTTLTTLARQHATAERPAPIAVASLADAPESEAASLVLAAGRLWCLGAAVDTAALDRRSRKARLTLPTYPFERKRFWLDAVPAAAAAASPSAAPPHPSLSIPEPAMSPSPPRQPADRARGLVERLRTMLEDISGLELEGADTAAPLVELGLDSLSLTQVAIQLKQTFKVNVTFRELMEQHRSIDLLAAHLAAHLPDEIPAAAAADAAPAHATALSALAAMPMLSSAAPGSLVEQVIRQQMALMQQQLALLGGGATSPATAPAAPAAGAQAAAPPTAKAGTEGEEPAGQPAYDAKKAFGAIARIHTDPQEITDRQRARLDAFIRRYVARTRMSKEYTARHRPHLADPRVVNGFRPVLKEIVYQVVIGRSKGAYVWDLDGNRYVDVLNGFGMNLFGWQPDFVNEAVRRQLDEGYEIGPQHPLAGEVARRICAMTGWDRAGLCNTGSEAVMGTMRIARTVTGRSTIVMFTGSYHGIFDEVIVRATRKLRAVPAAPGILPNTSQNVLVLDYGTPESMQIIRSRGAEIAAVLVEPVQSRRPDFQPVEFLRELREATRESGSLLILDEVVTGFRSHPAGVRGLFGVEADLCTYGKVVGGGMPIGVIAGKREFMDALDGGGWQYGDDSIPTVGVTYFAGTFVRHPLALAAANAVLEHLERAGPGLQEGLTRATTAMVDELNAFCADVGAPIALKSFASVWRVSFTEDHPLQDLLFAMMRSRGVHVLDNFPCFMTTAHGEAEIALVKAAFRESVIELQEADFLPKRAPGAAFDASKPPVPGARIGKDPDGKPAWFVPNPDKPGKYMKVDA